MKKRAEEPASFADADEASRDLKKSIDGLRTYVAAVRCAMDPEAAADAEANSRSAADDDAQRSSGLG